MNKKLSFYKIMSVLFFITGLVFGIFAFVSGSETGAIENAIDESGYVQTMSEQVDFKLFAVAVGIPWFLCAFFGYCDGRSEAGVTLKEFKELISDVVKK